jgi:hypothetical protein
VPGSCSRTHSTSCSQPLEKVATSNTIHWLLYVPATDNSQATGGNQLSVRTAVYCTVHVWHVCKESWHSGCTPDGTFQWEFQQLQLSPSIGTGGLLTRVVLGEELHPGAPLGGTISSDLRQADREGGRGKVAMRRGRR